MPSDLVRLIARVPPELRAEIKAKAARRRRSLQSVVIEALEDWIQAHPSSDEARERWDRADRDDFA